MTDWTLEKALKVYDDVKRYRRNQEWVQIPNWILEFNEPVDDLLFEAMAKCADAFLEALIESHDENKRQRRQLQELNKAILKFYAKQ